MFNLVTELRFQLLITQESNSERQVWGKIKDSFIEENKGLFWGDRGLMYQRTSSSLLIRSAQVEVGDRLPAE